MRKPSYVLDSYVVLAYLQAEPAGGPLVKDLLKQARAGDASLFLSLINLGEIIYTIERKLGDEISKDILQDILRLPIQLAEVTMDRVPAAAHIKANHAIALLASGQEVRRRFAPMT